MAFDADEMLQGLEPPTITVGGRTYRGRLLSLEEWAPFEPDIRRAMQREMDVAELREFLRRYVDTIFPRPWWAALSRPRMSSVVLALPLKVQMEALRDFLACQGRTFQGNPGSEESAEPDASDSDGGER